MGRLRTISIRAGALSGKSHLSQAIPFWIVFSGAEKLKKHETKKGQSSAQIGKAGQIPDACQQIDIIHARHAAGYL